MYVRATCAAAVHELLCCRTQRLEGWKNSHIDRTNDALHDEFLRQRGMPKRVATRSQLVARNKKMVRTKAICVHERCERSVRNRGTRFSTQHRPRIHMLIVDIRSNVTRKSCDERCQKTRFDTKHAIERLRNQSLAPEQFPR